MTETREINLDLLLPPENRIRAGMDDEQMHELVESIKRYGVLQNLVVTPDNGKYRIVGGERRSIAARLAGLVTVPCKVYENVEDAQYGMMLDENTCREGLTAAEEGMQFLDLAEKRGWSMPQLQKHFGRSEEYINERVKLVTKFPEVMKRVVAREMTWSQAKAIMRLKNAQWQAYLIEQAVTHGATARTLSNMIDQFHAQDLAAAGKPPPHTPEHSRLLQEPERRVCTWCQRDDDQVNLTQIPIHSYHVKDLTEYLRATGVASRSPASPPMDPRAA